MKKIYLFSVFGFLFFVLSGCIVRTYTVTKDRVDQDLAAGNRGYISGQTPGDLEVKERKLTRTSRVLEVELHSPIKIERLPKQEFAKPAEDKTVEGNRGYIFRSTHEQEEAVSRGNFQKYIVQKGDTLQKISQKLFGTTKKWTKIYEANKDKLKAPNKIYPGQALNVPAAGIPLKESEENLK